MGNGKFTRDCLLPLVLPKNKKSSRDSCTDEQLNHDIFCPLPAPRALPGSFCHLAGLRHGG
jgi:hypothetical protein